MTIDFFYEEGDDRHVSAGGARRRGAQRHQPQEQVRAAAARLSEAPRSPTCGSIDCTFDGVTDGDVIEAVRDLARTNVVVNGTAITDRVTR